MVIPMTDEPSDVCGICGGNFSDDEHAMLSGDCPVELAEQAEANGQFGVGA